MELNESQLFALVNKSVDGNMASCQKLYEYLVNKVYAYVHYRVATAEYAIDLTQDIFIDFFNALKNFSYQSRSQLFAFVFVITKRKLAQHYNNKNVFQAKTTAEFDDNLMSADSDYKNSLTMKENNLDLNQALASLDEQTREIVVLHHWSKYTFGEIAQLLNLTETTVRVRHFRALKLLKQFLARQ